MPDGKLGWTTESKRGLGRASGYLSLLSVDGALLLLPRMHQLSSKNRGRFPRDPGILLSPRAHVERRERAIIRVQDSDHVPRPAFPMTCFQTTVTMIPRDWVVQLLACDNGGPLDLSGRKC